jgi:hypothetical protein
MRGWRPGTLTLPSSGKRRPRCDRCRNGLDAGRQYGTDHFRYYWIVKRKQSRRKVLSAMRSVISNSAEETKMNAQTKVRWTLTGCGALAAAFMATTALTGAMTANVPAFAGEPVVVETNLPGSFSKLIAETRPAVVSIIVKKRDARLNLANDRSFGRLDEFLKRFNLPQGFGQQFKMPGKPDGRSPTGQGSGFFISEDGYIVTNNHVIDGADEIKVRLHDRRTLKAKLIGTDAKTDLAVLKVDGNDFQYVTFGDSDTAKVGDWVVAVGDPFGLSGTATAGIISARGRDIGSGPYDEFMQIDASINKGNSGGPTFNRRGGSTRPSSPLRVEALELALRFPRTSRRTSSTS